MLCKWWVWNGDSRQPPATNAFLKAKQQPWKQPLHILLYCPFYYKLQSKFITALLSLVSDYTDSFHLSYLLADQDFARITLILLYAHIHTDTFTFIGPILLLFLFHLIHLNWVNLILLCAYTLVNEWGWLWTAHLSCCVTGASYVLFMHNEAVCVSAGSKSPALLLVRKLQAEGVSVPSNMPIKSRTLRQAFSSENMFIRRIRSAQPIKANSGRFPAFTA